MQTVKERPRGVARIIPFAGAIALGAIFIAVFVGSPFELTREAHLAAWQVGLVLLAISVGATVAARVAGALVQRGLGVATMLAGLAVSGAVACVLLRTPATDVALLRFVQNLAISGGAALSGLLIDRVGTSSIWIFTIGVCIVAIVTIAALSFGANRAATKAPPHRASQTQ